MNFSGPKNGRENVTAKHSICAIMSRLKGTMVLKPNIIFEDTHLIVLSKPAGLLSQGERKGDPNLVDWLREYLGRNYVGLVHRLDRNTSGIMVVAKRTKAARRLTQAMQEGKLKRTYLACLQGKLLRRATWVHWLLKDTERNQVEVVSEKHLKAKKAILHVKPISHGQVDGLTLTLAEFELETGRSHQVRVQTAEEGYPVLGDPKYGQAARNSKRGTLSRPALHSSRIQFPHPMTEEALTFEAPLPKDMVGFFKEAEG
jgi:23S rRNA pseudouridine1911/1915/1917 synthase